MKQTLFFITIFLAINTAQAQIFIAQAALEDFYENDDITEFLHYSGFSPASFSSMPPEISEPIEKMTNYIHENIERTEDYLYINEVSASFLVYGLDNDGVFLYAANYFTGNEHAVNRIREMLENSGLELDSESNGMYYYSQGEDAGGIVGLLENGLVVFAYFEP